MRFGMPSLVEHEGIPQALALCGELGLDFVEFNMSMPLYRLDELKKADLAARAMDSGLFYTIHFDENAALFDFEDSIAEAYLDLLLRTADVAVKLGIPVINMHFEKGIYATLPDRRVYLFERYRDTFHSRLLKVQKRCEAALHGAPLTLCIENTGGFLPFQTEALEMLLKSPVFGLTWDIGHSANTEIDDERFMLRHESRIRHMHAHDVADGKDHRLLGEGKVNLAEKLGLAQEHDLTCVIEIKTEAALKTSLSWLRAHRWLP